MIAVVYVVLALVVGLVFLVSSRNRSQQDKNLPPGPPCLPLIGNAHQMDFVRMHLTFEQWSKTYGEIVRARVGSVTLIVLNSYAVAKEALIQQGDNFSARPEFYTLETITKGRGYIRSDGWLWKEQRRNGLHLLRDFGLGRSTQERKIADETVELFAEFEKNMKPIGQDTRSVRINPIVNIKFAVVNIINNILFGERFPYGDKQFAGFIKLFNDVLYATNRQLPMEFFPVLRLVPWLFGLNKTAEYFQLVMDHYRDQIKKHRATLEEDLASGSPSDFTYAYLAEIDKRQTSDTGPNSFTEDQLAQNLSDLFSAGFETTATTLSWFLLYMLHYPEAQGRMRDEIEGFLGRKGAVPEWVDRGKLPYSCAVIAEVQRHANIVPFGVFHSCFQDATIKGYRIPKGSMVAINHWTIMRDKTLFPEAEAFKPERFLMQDGSFSEKVDGFIPFSMGKRACMGESLARMELFLFATAVVSRYRLKPVDPEILPTMDPISQFTLAPHPFELVLELNE